MPVRTSGGTSNYVPPSKRPTPKKKATNRYPTSASAGLEGPPGRGWQDWFNAGRRMDQPNGRPKVTNNPVRGAIREGPFNPKKRGVPGREWFRPDTGTKTSSVRGGPRTPEIKGYKSIDQAKAEARSRTPGKAAPTGEYKSIAQAKAEARGAGRRSGGGRPGFRPTPIEDVGARIGKGRGGGGGAVAAILTTAAAFGLDWAQREGIPNYMKARGQAEAKGEAFRKRRAGMNAAVVAGMRQRAQRQAGRRSSF